LNILVIDLTKDTHYLAINYNNKKHYLSFCTQERDKKNDWIEKINKIKDEIPDFSFDNLNSAAYAAGPGSYTGARLAFTFLDTIKLLTNCDFYAFSNLSALQWNNDSMTPVIKGNKNDYFYKVNEKEMYCKNPKEIPEKHGFISYSSEMPELDNVKELTESEIASNILEMMLDNVENALELNYPNYIKELDYKKIDG
tara:strand:- start:11062 stop:11652 length:591 start_codon:yes stop_codon:yes gene_type:complete